jgi:peptidoglycan/LPS O-acetylase OafA/YrhL
VSWQGAPTRGWRWDVVSLVGWPALFVLWHTPDPWGIVSGSGDDTLLAALLFPPLALLLYGAVFRGPLTNRAMTNPWITTIGGMCYTIYLLHNRVIGVAIGWTKGWAGSGSYTVDLLVQLVLVAPVVLAVCAAYFLLVERPCMARDWPRRARARLGQAVSVTAGLGILRRSA